MYVILLFLLLFHFRLDLPPVEPLPIDSAHNVSMVTAGTPHNFFILILSLGSRDSHAICV